MYAGAYIQRCKGSVTDMGRDEYVSGFFIKGIPKIHSPPPPEKIMIIAIMMKIILMKIKNKIPLLCVYTYGTHITLAGSKS